MKRDRPAERPAVAHPTGATDRGRRRATDRAFVLDRPLVLDRPTAVDRPTQI